MYAKSSLAVAICLTTLSSVALADPLTSTAPLSQEPMGLAPGGTPPASDLPAPEKTSWVNKPLLLTSTVLLVGSYAPMAAVAFTSDRPADQTNLYYPVVGPWMNLADRQCDARACGNEGLNKAMLILDGVGQGLGAIGIVTSLFLPGKTTRNWFLIGNDNVHAGPTRMGLAGYGFGAAGSF